MPSVLLLVIYVAFFSVLIARANAHNKQLWLAHQEELAEQRLHETEDEIVRIVYQQQEILNSKDFLEFTCMYEDLDWYSRYRLQNELYEEVNTLYVQNPYVEDAYLYWPKSGRAISSSHATVSMPSWLTDGMNTQPAGFQWIDGKLASIVVRDDLRPYEKAVLVAFLDEKRIVEGLQYILSDECIPKIIQDDKDQETQNDSACMFILESTVLPVRILYHTEDTETDQFVGEVMRITLYAVAVMVMIVIGSLGLWHAWIYQPLHRLLIDAFGQTEAGNFSYRISIPHDSPFFSVYGSYNRMMQTIEGYIEKDLKQQVLVSRANLKQLQSQISPHFMYNSYYVLYRLLKKGDIENSRALAEHLGHFYHYVTRTADDEKHLDEEVEHARNYAAIQKSRFRDALDVEIREPDSAIAKAYVPRLILQPLLENAFKHAYENENGSGTMRLLVWYKVRDAHDFDILVENSGSVSDDTLNAIRNRLENQDDRIEPTALVNIHRRLQIYFGPHSRLEVDRSDLGGLLVRMHIEDRREDM